MAAFSNGEAAYFDAPSSRSPRDFGNPQMRNNTRVGGFGNMQGNMQGTFGADMNQHRFANSRDAFGGGMAMQNIPVNNLNFPYDANAAQTWSSGAPVMSSFQGNSMNGMGQNGNYGQGARSLKPSRARPGVNDIWANDGQPSYQNNHSMLAPRSAAAMGQGAQEDDEELIPTAIVIKNIPFAVKKEQLVQLMVDMNLPLPYAFNYHFDNGVFRGLAFANFTSPNETDQVINALNHMELSGRKLRVEYKKMLPLAERERIEREKRERRGQLEEQHRPVAQSQLHNQLSLSSMSRNTPSPLSQRAGAKPELDMNDPKTLEFYTEMSIFRRDPSREVMIFSADLDPSSRRIIHTMAHHMGLAHTSRGTGEQRQVHVYRPAPGTNVSPPSLSGGFSGADGGRPPYPRGSNSDMHDGSFAQPHFDRLRGQSSLGLLDVGEYGRAGADNNLRNAKSFADLRSWSPSPVPSSASFPAALQPNGTRLQQAQSSNETAGSNTPVLTPTASSGTGTGSNEPAFLISGFSGLNMASGSATQTSPRRQRMFGGWDESQSYQPTAGTIGSGPKRSVSMAPESTSQERLNSIRQPRGPSANNNGGFRRNQRGSDELRTAPAIAE